MKELVKELCGLFGPSGMEDQVRDFIIAQIKDHADKMMVDANGSVIAFKRGAKGTDKAVMLAAHMDEVGIIVTGITEKGYLKFSFVGGVDSRVVMGRRLVIGDKRINGVIGCKAIHLVSAAEEKKAVKADKMYIDIGASSREEAMELVSLGDYGCFYSETFDMANDMIKAKALDDRVGCAAMIKLIQSDLPIDTWFAFTVQEEIGTRGALGAAFRIKPDIALIMEGTTAADIPSMPQHKQVCGPGKGVVIPFMDGGSIYDRELFELLRDTAVENDIPWQTKQYISGGTDASAIQKTAGSTRVCGIAAALRYIHSPSSVGCMRDIENMPVLATKFLEKLGEIL